MPAFPLVRELALPNLEEVFGRLSRLPHCLWLDSALKDKELGRYSFLAADPFEFLEFSADAPSDPLAVVAARLHDFPAETIPGLPPFQGGAAGLVSYDLGRFFERVPPTRFDEFRVPVLAMGLYDVVLEVDHLEERAWIVSQGFPERDFVRRRRRAEERLSQFVGWALPTSAPSLLAGEGGSTPHPGPPPQGGREATAPQFACSADARVTSNFSEEGYLAAVEQAIEYIRAGDIFQVNLSQRLLCPARDDSPSLYLRLRRRNRATFAGYFDLGELQIASASPERFLQVRGRQVEARPIKGTRRRSHFPEADLVAASELKDSEKDRTENVMIVDLLRNDLSRVCLPDSVRVTELCKLENYEYVQHLVSAIRGELAEGRTALDALRAAFPGGSITGAPKVRAMEIIAELEPTARGPYCGSLAYVGFDGSMDSSILIRTITCGRGFWQAAVGGGIVAQSDPKREYEETWIKAEGLLRALE